MSQWPNPGNYEDSDSLRNLYSEVLQADHELKQLVDEMPRFFKPGKHLISEIPVYMPQQSSVISLSSAHKV